MKTWAIIAAVTALALGAAYLFGRQDGKQSAEIDAQKATTRQEIERGKTDAEINRLDARGVCYELGGVWRNGNCE